MRRLLAARAVVSAVCLAVSLGVLGAGVPAQAAPPAQRTVTDAREPGKAYDVLRVTLTAAPRVGRKAKVVVEHARQVRVGDVVDLWFDLDDDRQPDLYLTGAAFSEYAVYKARGWAGHGRDISGRGCATLRMAGTRSVVRVDPGCLGRSRHLAVSVRSLVTGRPSRTADRVPGAQRLTRRISSYVTG